jgi:hypothetical protein
MLLALLMTGEPGLEKAKRGVTYNPTLESLSEAARDTQATSIPQGSANRVGFIYNTNTNAGIAAGKTTSTLARTVPCTVITAIPEVGRATAEVAGNPSTSRSQSCKGNRKCAGRTTNPELQLYAQFPKRPHGRRWSAALARKTAEECGCWQAELQRNRSSPIQSLARRLQTDSSAASYL